MNGVLEKIEEDIEKDLAGECIELRSVEMQCGILSCARQYEVTLVPGKLHSIECPRCQNASLQLLRG